MKLEFGLLADNAQIDASGKLFILGEFRYINAAAVPAIHNRMVVVFRLSADAVEVRDTQKAHLELEIVDGDGNSIGTPARSPKMEVKFAPVGPADRGRWWAQVTIELGGLPLPKFGDYSIFIFVNGQSIGSIPFYLNKIEPPAGAKSQ